MELFFSGSNDRRLLWNGTLKGALKEMFVTFVG